MAANDQNPAWLRQFETKTTPPVTKASADARIRGAEADVAPAAAAADVGQKQASAASSKATAGRIETLTPLEAAEKQFDIQAKQDKADRDAAARAAAAQAKATQAQERINTVLEKLAQARRLVSNFSTGYGSLLSGLPTTDARSLKSILGPEGTIGSQILLRTMDELRQGSAAGATGLGAMDRNENATLKSSISSLDLGRSPEEVLQSINEIERSFRRYGAITSGFNPDEREVAIQFGLIPPEDRKDSRGIPAGTIGGATSEENVVRPSERRGLNVTVSKMLSEGRSAADIKAYLDKVEPGLGEKTINLDWWENELKKPKEQQKYRPEDYIDVETLRTEASAPEKAIGSFAQSPVGTALLGATDFATGGILPQFTSDPEATRAAIKGAELDRPGAFLAGQAIGGITGLAGAEGALLAKYGPELAAKYGIPALTALQSGLYGYSTSDEEGLSAVPDALQSAALAYGGGKAGEYLGKGFGKVVGGVGDEAVDFLRARGVPLNFGEIMGGKAREFTGKMADMPIVGPFVSARLSEGAEGFNRAAFKEALQELGEYYTDIGPDIGERGLRAARRQVSNAFDEALEGVRLRQDEVFQRNLSNTYTALGELPDVGPKLLKALNDQLGELLKPGRNLTGKEVQAALRKVDRIGRSFKNNELYESSIAPRLNSVSDEIRGVVERQAPDVLPKFDAARSAYRKVSIVNDAVKRSTKGEGADTRGVFSPQDLQTAGMANAEKFTGKGSSVSRGYPLQDLAEAGIDVLVPPSRSGLGVSLPLTAAGLVGGANYLTQPGQQTNPVTGVTTGEERDPITSGIYGLGAAGLATLPFTRTGQKAITSFMLSPRNKFLQDAGALIEKYGPQVLGGSLGATFGGIPTRGTPEVTGAAPVEFQPVQVSPKNMAQEGVAEGEGPVLVDDRPTEMREDGRRYFVGTNELADADTDPLAERSNPAREFAMGGLAHSLGPKPESTEPSYAMSEADSPPPVFSTQLPMKTGGVAKKAARRVPAFKTGGKACIADMARHYGTRR